MGMCSIPLGVPTEAIFLPACTREWLFFYRDLDLDWGFFFQLSSILKSPLRKMFITVFSKI